MATAQIELKNQTVELSEKSFKTFCNDIIGMFGIKNMECARQQVTNETIEGLKKRFSRVIAVNSVKAEGTLDGTFQLIFGREGLFILGGVVTMPEQMNSLSERFIAPKKILEHLKSGSLKEAEEMRDAMAEAGNMLVGAWDRVFRKELDGHGHFAQSNLFIGEPWDEPEEKIGLASSEKVLLVSMQISVGAYPPFDCGVIFPRTLFGDDLDAAEAEAEAQAKAEAKEKLKAEAEAAAKAKIEAEEKARAEAEAAEKAKAEAEEKTKTEAEAAAQAKAEAEAEAKAKAEAEAKVKAEAEAEAQAKAEAEEKAKTEAEEKTRIYAEAEEKAKTEAEEKAKIEAKEGAEEKAEGGAEVKAEGEAEEKAEVEVEAGAEAEEKAKAEAEAAAKAKAEAEEKAKAEAEEKAKAEAEATRVEVEEKAATMDDVDDVDDGKEPAVGGVSETIQKMPCSAAVLPGESDHISLAMCAQEIMQKDVVWGSGDDSVQQALTKMQQAQTGYMLVGTDGQLEGIVSKSDITGAVSIYLRPIFAKWRRPLDDATLQIRVKWIMSRPVRTIKPETSLTTIMENMRQFGGRCLPMVDQQGKVQGLVTVFDIYQALLSGSPNISYVGKTHQAPPLGQLDLSAGKEAQDAKQR